MSASEALKTSASSPAVPPLEALTHSVVGGDPAGRDQPVRRDFEGHRAPGRMDLRPLARDAAMRRSEDDIVR